MKKFKLLILGLMAALFVGTLFVPAAFAADHVKHLVDLGANYFTLSTSDKNVGHTGVVWNKGVAVNGTFQFNIYFSITEQGGQKYPQYVTYGVTATTPSGTSIPVSFGGTSATTYTFNASGSTSTATVQVNITAPANPGAYTVTLFPTAKGGDGGNPRLADDYGITIGFTAANGGCTPQKTELFIDPSESCVTYKEPSTTFTATLLTSNNEAVPGKDIDFTIAKGGGQKFTLGSVETDENGEAILVLDTSSLSVGGYTITASFQGDECYLEPAPAIATLGVKYDFLGFQPPVKIDGVGAGLFSGKVIPVKIKIADYYGDEVPDAMIYLTYKSTSAAVSTEPAEETESVSSADTGNLMRYDPVADQYIYNWDVSKLPNGDYTLFVDMGEGCESDHNVTVVIQKNSGKKK